MNRSEMIEQLMEYLLAEKLQKDVEAGEFGPSPSNFVLQEGFQQHNSSWQEVSQPNYRGWVDRVTGQWRQLQFFLADLSKPTTTSASLALAGLQSTGAAPASIVIGTLEIAPPDADVEVMVAVQPDATQDDELCQIVATVTLHGKFFGDFSGVVVTLLGGAMPQTLVTNEQGKVIFARTPRTQLAAMSLVVKLPDQEV